MKTLKVLLISVVMFGMLSSVAVAQDLEVFKTRMAAAAEMTKKDMSEALLKYLEIRADFAGPEVDYSLGRVYQRLNQCMEAQQYYTNVMVKYDLPESNPIYQRAVSDFDAVSSCSSWQKFYVECDVPVGGYVMIDSERMGSCWERPFVMAAGEHTFKLVSKDGKETEVKKTAVDGGKDVHVKLAFPVEKVSVEKVVEVEKAYVYKERFSPYLYWSLIAGGVAFVAVGGGFAALANQSYADQQKYADYLGFAMANGEKDDVIKDWTKKRDDANSKVKGYNGASYTFIALGIGATVTGVALAIVSATSEKEKVYLEDGESDVKAFVVPTLDGASVGLNVRF
ncbi:MAG: hypothetical protein IJU23_06500 [Proteobacteria bacterium]|nr:hypothetical protein [Pseudomonadota bacterium]